MTIYSLDVLLFLLVSAKQILFLFVYHAEVSTLVWVSPKADMIQGFKYKRLFERWSGENTDRGNQKWDREGKAVKKECIIKPVTLMGTRVWPYWRTQLDGIEHGSVNPMERCESEVFTHHIPIHHWLKVFLMVLTRWHFWHALHTGQVCLCGQ